MVDVLLNGKLIENYRIIAVLGRGGMGTVYKAFDEELQREVVLKMMNIRYLEDMAFVRQFRKEGISQARLKHPNIVDVHALRESKLGMFIVMEYIPGQTLAAQIREGGAMPWQQALLLFDNILKGIEHAHEKGVIHRDIKPGNIMLSNDGSVKVSDFGIARMNHDPRMTHTGLSGGTLAYSSPEQLKNLKLADERSDVYSLGITFYEVLTGALPFKEGLSAHEVQQEILSGKFLSPRRKIPELPKALARVILQSICKKPEKRFQSVQEMRQALAVVQPQTVIGDITDFSRKIRSSPKFSFSVSRRLQAVIYFLLLIIAAWAMDAQTSFLNFFQFSSGETRSLSINSDPDNAFVYLNGNILGVTPIWDREIAFADSAHIRIEKHNYLARDTTIALAADSAMTVAFQLVAERGNRKRSLRKTSSTAKRKGSLQVRTIPPGAEIWLAGKRLPDKQSPVLIRDLLPGDYQVNLRRQGYQTFSDIVTVKNGIQAELTVNLQFRRGDVSILVLPYGSIYIDGKLRKENTHSAYQTTLSPGRHTIRATHPMYGSWEKKITVVAGRQLELAADFNRTFDVRIIAFDDNEKPLMGDVFIDGQPSEYSTPVKMPLRFGNHKIEVRRKGYRQSSGARAINLEEELTTPLKFVLKKIPGE